MDDDLWRQLELKIDGLLIRQQRLEQEIIALRAGNAALMSERERFRAELDRILAKFQPLDQEIT